MATDALELLTLGLDFHKQYDNRVFLILFRFLLCFLSLLFFFLFFRIRFLLCFLSRLCC